MKCNNCGNILNEDATSCFLCGSNDLSEIKTEKISTLNIDEQENEINNEELNNDNKLKNGKIYIAISLVLSLLFIVLTIISKYLNIEKYNYLFIAISLLIIILLYTVSLWKIFVKTGRSGYISIIPIYNLYTLQKITIGSSYLFVLFFIPIVNTFYILYLFYHLSILFGKSKWYSIGMIFLSFVYLPLMSFDESKYLGVKKK